MVFIAGDVRSLSLPFVEENVASDFQRQAGTNSLGISVPVRENLIAPGTGVLPGPILYRHTVLMWLPTARLGGQRQLQEEGEGL